MSKIAPNHFQHSENSILNHPHEPTGLFSSPSENLPICKICLEGEPTVFDHLTGQERINARLIVPCECSGSMGYVHQKCIRTWIQKQLQNSGKHQMECQICKSFIYFKTKNIKYCEFSCENLKNISGCNILSIIVELNLLTLLIMLYQYSAKFTDSTLFRYVLIFFVSILVLASSFTVSVIIKSAFLKVRKQIGRIYSIQESQQLGLREIQVNAGTNQPDKQFFKGNKNGNRISIVYYVSSNARRLQTSFASAQVPIPVSYH